MNAVGTSPAQSPVRPAGSGWSRRSLLKALPYLLFILPPFVLSSQLDVWVNPLLIGIAGAVGLNVLTGTTGLISLGQAGFLAVGAYTSVAVSVTAGLPFPVALVASVASGGLVGAIVGLSTSRLRGLYAVIATLALQYVVVYIGTRYEEVANATAAFVLPTATLGGWSIASSDRWYLVLAIVAAAYVALYQQLLRSHAGRALEVIGDRDRVAPMLGINVGRYEMYAWILSGAAVSLVGSVEAFYLSAVSPDFFTLSIAIQYFAMIVIGGRGSPLGSVLGAAVLITLPFGLQNLANGLGGSAQAADFSDYDTIAYGVLLIIFLVVAPDGLVGRFKALGSGILRQVTGPRRAGRAQPAAPAGATAPAAATAKTTQRQPPRPYADPAEAILQVRDLAVGYKGGSVALRDVNLDVRAGEVVAVLGPNGAGKTTLLRTIAGFASDEPGFLTAGTVIYQGKAVQDIAAFRRAKDGIVLVPEREKVFPGLTVMENIELASPSRRESRSRADEALEMFPALRPRLNSPAVLLSGGERQMLAIARGLMLRPRLLLLDETTLGLAPIIAEQVMMHIGQVARSRGTSVLLVEQNAALAELVADRYYSLQNGEISGSLTAGHGLSHDTLIREYFGRQADE